MNVQRFNGSIAVGCFFSLFSFYLPVPQAIAHHLTAPSLPMMSEIVVEVEHDNVYHLRVT